ncbi:MAG: nickel-dependent lactate racemase [Anaerolineae bacterium]|nr:nickel-dependent lactate racemase [Anaerolineae bacterium]
MKGTCKVYYKGQELWFDLPEGWNLVASAEPKDASPLEDVAARVRELLARPLGMPPLEEVVRNLPHTRTVIITDDAERPTPAGQVLEPLWAELNRLGIPNEAIDVVIGRGTHRVPTQEEIRAKLGARVVDRLRVTVHDPDAPDLVHVGTTRRGTEVRVNRLVAEAALVIGIGLANPHYFAGYGGGPKLILPGVCSRQTICQNHAWIRDPNARTGVTHGNPIWEDMLEAARLARLTYKLDVVLNTQQAIHQVFGGEVEAVQGAAAEVIRDLYGVPVPGLADVTVSSAHPLEFNFIQSGKAVMAADEVTKPGGTIVLVSACPGGFGPLLYETLSQRPEPDEVIGWMLEGKANPTGGTMASRIRRIAQSKRVVVVSEGLPAEQLADMGFAHAASVEEALAQVAAEDGRRDVVVLPAGGNTFAYIPAEA